MQVDQSVSPGTDEITVRATVKKVTKTTLRFESDDKAVRKIYVGQEALVKAFGSFPEEIEIVVRKVR